MGPTCSSGYSGLHEYGMPKCSHAFGAARKPKLLTNRACGLGLLMSGLRAIVSFDNLRH